MKIILLITVLETLVVALWMLALRHSRKRGLEVAVVGVNRPLTSGDSLIIKLPAPNPLDAKRWTFINEWHVEAQADDRKPMRGRVIDSSGSPSSRRSVARRSHQLEHKEWSKERHE